VELEKLIDQEMDISLKLSTQCGNSKKKLNTYLKNNTHPLTMAVCAHFLGEEGLLCFARKDENLPEYKLNCSG
jgi:hypothetical protein